MANQCQLTELMLCVMSSPVAGLTWVAVTTQAPHPAWAHMIFVPVIPR